MARDAARKAWQRTTCMNPRFARRKRWHGKVTLAAPGSLAPNPVPAGTTDFLVALSGLRRELNCLIRIAGPRHWPTRQPRTSAIALSHCRTLRNFFRRASVPSGVSKMQNGERDSVAGRSGAMDGNIVGFAAVVMVFGIPMAGMYTYFRVRRLTHRRTPGGTGARRDGSDGARAFPCGALAARGHSVDQRCHWLYSRLRADRARRARCLDGSSLRRHTLAVGVGFFLDSTLIRRDARA